MKTKHEKKQTKQGKTKKNQRTTQAKIASYDYLPNAKLDSTHLSTVMISQST